MILVHEMPVPCLSLSWPLPHFESITDPAFLGYLHPAPSHSVIVSGRKSPPDVSQLRCAFQAQLCKSTRQSQPVGGKCGQAQSSCSQSPSQNCLNSAFCRATLAASFALLFSFRLIEMHKGCLKSMDKKCTWLWHSVSKTSSSLSHSKSPRGSWGWTAQL